jgi:HEAT repeat protein
VDPGARVAARVAAEALSRAVADRRAEVRAAAAVSLGVIGGFATEYPDVQGSARVAAETLSRALTDRRAEVRAAAAEGLTWLAGGEPPVRAVPWEIAAAQGHARLVGGEPPGGGLPFDPVPMADALAGAMRDPSVEVRTASRRALTALATRAAIVPPAGLLAALGPAGSADLREGALAVMPAFGTRLGQSIPLLIEALSDRDPGLRYRAAGVLGGAGPAARAAVPALIAVLQEPFVPQPDAPAPTPAGRPPVDVPPDRWDPACEAARALGWIARGASASVAREAVAALAGTLRSEHYWRRHAAAEGLFLLGKGAAAAGPELASALAESVAAEGDGREANSWAARALGLAAPGAASEAEAIAALTRALNSSHQGTRTWSVDSLGRFGPPASSALPRLRALRDDRDRFIAATARAAVARIEDVAVPVSPPDRSRPPRDRNRSPGP